MATAATFYRRPPAAASGSGSNRPEDLFRLRALPNEDVFLFSKRIDNSRVVREPDPHARGEWSMIGMACLLALLLMGALSPRVANVFAGYRLQSLKQERESLLGEQRELNITEARLSRQDHLETMAKSRDLATPSAQQIVHLDPKNDSRLALNRH